MDCLTVPQFHVAVALAATYGHAWGWLAVAPAPLPGSAEAAERLEYFGEEPLEQDHADYAAVRDELRSGAVAIDTIRVVTSPRVGHFDDHPAPALDDSGCIVHVTGSRRLRWSVARDGSATIEIRRPFKRDRVHALIERRQMAYGDRAAPEMPGLGRAECRSPELTKEWAAWRAAEAATSDRMRIDESVGEAAAWLAVAQRCADAARALREAADALIASISSEIDRIREGHVVLRGHVAHGRGLPHVRVDIAHGAAYHVEHVDDLVRALRAAGADERGIDVACARAYETALPDRPGRGRSERAA